MRCPWPNLKYWNTGEWQVVEEHLDDLAKAGKEFCPTKPRLFEALRRVRPNDVKVLIVGQDPYPNPAMATGVAFEVPEDVWKGDFPPTLCNIFNELSTDLGLPYPENGHLKPWTDQGVLLWNAVPSCLAWKSMSHNWPEWQPLTEEIVRTVSAQEGMVVVLMGAVAREFAPFVASTAKLIETSHPSPRGSLNSNCPFKGSRIFSTINANLKEPILWQLS